MMSVFTFELKGNCFLVAEEVEVCGLSDALRKEQGKKKTLCVSAAMKQRYLIRPRPRGSEV